MNDIHDGVGRGGLKVKNIPMFNLPLNGEVSINSQLDISISWFNYYGCVDEGIYGIN